jgi:hypothetical protein
MPALPARGIQRRVNPSIARYPAPEAVTKPEAMTTRGPHPLFHGKVVRVEVSPFVLNRRAIAAQVYGLVLRMENASATEDELVVAIYMRLAQHVDLVARLVSHTDDRIEFMVTRQ